MRGNEWLGSRRLVGKEWKVSLRYFNGKLVWHLGLSFLSRDGFLCSETLGNNTILTEELMHLIVSDLRGRISFPRQEFLGEGETFC